MSILDFLDPKFQKICSEYQIFHEIITQICYIYLNLLFKMTYECNYDLNLGIFHKFTPIFAIFLSLKHT
jgi:hypothetical protein